MKNEFFEGIIDSLNKNKLSAVKNSIEWMNRIDKFEIYKLNLYLIENYSNSSIIVGYAKTLKMMDKEALAHFEKSLTNFNKKYVQVKYEKHIHKNKLKPRFLDKLSPDRKVDFSEFLMYINPKYNIVLDG